MLCAIIYFSFALCAVQCHQVQVATTMLEQCMLCALCGGIQVGTGTAATVTPVLVVPPVYVVLVRLGLSDMKHVQGMRMMHCHWASATGNLGPGGSSR